MLLLINVQVTYISLTFNVFKYSYSLEQTEQFLHTLLDDEPVRTVVASESLPENNEKCRAPSKERVRTHAVFLQSDKRFFSSIYAGQCRFS